jgi:lipocalin
MKLALFQLTVTTATLLCAAEAADYLQALRGFAGFAVSGSSGCRTVSPLPNLDLGEYTRASWYIQEQQITCYQPLKDLNCVVATYDVDKSRTVPFFSGTVVSVFNYAQTPDGKPMGSYVDASGKRKGTTLCAREPDAKSPAKLEVAPCFLPNFLAGDYWVVAAGGLDAGQYDWAVVSAGQPTVQYPDGCTTKETGINGSGLWLFTREKDATDEMLGAARQAAADLGFTLSRLHRVKQGDAACKGYPGLNAK